MNWKLFFTVVSVVYGAWCALVLIGSIVKYDETLLVIMRDAYFKIGFKSAVKLLICGLALLCLYVN